MEFWRGTEPLIENDCAVACDVPAGSRMPGSQISFTSCPGEPLFQDLLVVRSNIVEHDSHSRVRPNVNNPSQSSEVLTTADNPYANFGLRRKDFLRLHEASRRAEVRGSPMNLRFGLHIEDIDCGRKRVAARAGACSFHELPRPRSVAQLRDSKICYHAVAFGPSTNGSTSPACNRLRATREPCTPLSGRPSRPLGGKALLTRYLYAFCAAAYTF